MTQTPLKSFKIGERQLEDIFPHKTKDSYTAKYIQFSIIKTIKYTVQLSDW